MSPSQTYQVPSDDGESLGSASKKKKSSRKDKHKKSKDGKSKDSKDKKSNDSKDEKSKDFKDGKPKDKKKKKDKSKKDDVDITPSSSVVPTPQKQSASKVLPSSQRELSPESPVQNAPAPQMRSVPTPQKTPVATPQKQRAYTPQKQPTKTVSPTRLEVQLPSSSQRREEYVEMTLDSNDESVEVTPTADPRTNPRFLSGMQLLRKEVTSPFIVEKQDVFGPVIPATPKSQVGSKPSSGKKSKSESVKKEKVTTPSSAKKKKKKNDRYIPGPAEVVQLSSGDDSDSDLELQAIYDTPKTKSASRTITPSKQSIAATIKNMASSGTVNDSDIEFQAIRKTPPSRNRSQSQPPSAKVSMTAQRNVSTPTKSSQVATPSSRSARASASKPDGKEAFQERARRCRTMSPSLAIDKTSGSMKQQQAAKPTPLQAHNPTVKGTPAPIKYTACIDLTQAMTSDDESFEKKPMTRSHARKEALRTTQVVAVDSHTGKKRSWEEMHSSSPVPENDNPSKKRKLENVVSRIVRNSLREKEKPVNGVETLQQRRRRESAEALAYFHLTGWKKLDKKNKRSPVASKTRGITSLFSWTEVRKLKKMLRERAD
ncbi:unnamed protein product [Clonostachys chloroleuca]|uniref:Uncharacterized protein n=1 Tax=Clonostachys chloroleuca TaxID=1926264 RepID=A0AA35QCL7_9HYPO|nr:unnamed protein product [Clonostachys chloroleuca]